MEIEKDENRIEEIAGHLSNKREKSDFVKLVERPHAEWEEITGRDDYCCEHCGAEMFVYEVEFEGSIENNRRLKTFTVYVSHRCSAQYLGVQESPMHVENCDVPWSGKCSAVETAYEF